MTTLGRRSCRRASAPFTASRAARSLLLTAAAGAVPLQAGVGRRSGDDPPPPGTSGRCPSDMPPAGVSTPNAGAGEGPRLAKGAGPSRPAPRPGEASR